MRCPLCRKIIGNTNAAVELHHRNNHPERANGVPFSIGDAANRWTQGDTYYNEQARRMADRDGGRKNKYNQSPAGYRSHPATLADREAVLQELAQRK